jgi:hypothetical protein
MATIRETGMRTRVICEDVPVMPTVTIVPRAALMYRQGSFDQSNESIETVAEPSNLVAPEEIQ